MKEDVKTVGASTCRFGGGVDHAPNGRDVDKGTVMVFLTVVERWCGLDVLYGTRVISITA